MDHVESSKLYLQATFPSDWTNEFVKSLTPSDDNNDVAVSKFQADIAGSLDVAAGRIFDGLNFSVISGEYINDLQTYGQRLNEIDLLAQTVAESVDIPGYPQMTIIGQELFQSNFYHWIKQAIKRYRSLIDLVNRHLIYQANTSEILYVLRKDDDQPVDSAAKKLYEVFQLNVELARIDHSISFDEEYFKDLILIQDQLKNLITSNSAASVLYKKCEFLLYKISFRLKESQKNYLYAIDFNYSTIQPTPVTEFSKYTYIINGHYNNGFPPQDYQQRREIALSKITNSQDLELDDYHSLIKYFKDEKKDLDGLKKLREPFKKYRDRVRPQSAIYNQKALDIAFCYLENNILSFELQEKQFTISNWKGKLKEYTDRADQFQNNNFFPYYKIVKEFLSKTIKEQFFIENSDLEIIGQLIEDFKDNLEKLRKNLGICAETDYLAYQSLFVDCITTIPDSSGTDRACFLSSSFVLPLNYKEFFEEFELFKAELYQFKSMSEIQKMIHKDRKDVKEVKEEIRRTDKRHIEILSIFAALVMFVSNEIQIFTRITNIANAAAYTFFFSFGLGLFVIMIWFITRPEGKKLTDLKATHWILFSFMSVGLIAAIVFIFVVGLPTHEQKELNKMQYMIDSAEKQKKIDTIKIGKHSNTSKVLNNLSEEKNLQPKGSIKKVN